VLGAGEEERWPRHKEMRNSLRAMAKCKKRPGERNLYGGRDYIASSRRGDKGVAGGRER